MKLLSIFIVFLSICGASVHSADVESGTLFWGNGDSLPGKLVSAKGNNLVWDASELFAEPLQIDLSVLSAVRFPEQEQTAVPASDEFRITMANNNVLFGNIAAVEDDAITFNSTRHGTFKLPKHQVLNLQRTQDKGLLFLGPRGLDGWKPRGTGSQLSDWREENDGSLQAVKGETGIYRKMTFPDRCEVEVILTSSGVPDFVMSLGGRENDNPRVEMWGDEMICRCGLDFVELRTVKPDERKLHIHVFTDFKKQVMAVYSNAGRLLGQTTSKNWERPTHGIIFEAVEGDLTIKRLRISEWDGKLPQNLLPGETRLHTKSGDIQYGAISGFSPETQKLRIEVKPDDGAPEGTEPKSVEVPVDEVTNIVLSTEEEKVNDVGKTLVAWKDGGFVSGDLVSLENGEIQIDTGYSPVPVACQLTGVRRIRLPNTAKAKEEPDRLFFEGGSLRGNLTVEDHDSAPIRWTPVGGRNATTLVSKGNARFQRGHEPEELTIDTNTYPDVVFMEGGDVFPCRIEKSDETTLHLVTPVADVRQVKHEQIKAVELGSITRARQVGFSDEGWKRTSGSATKTDDKLSFRTTGTYGHENVLTGNEVSFKLKWTPQTYGSLTTWLFAEKLYKPEFGTPVTFSFSPNQLTVTDQVPQQNNNMVFFGGVPQQQAKSGVVKTTTREVDVQIVGRDGKIVVRVDGKEVKSFDINAKGTGARGLLFGSAITQVRNRVVLNGRVQNNAGGTPLEISNLRIQNVAGTSVAQFINEEARSRTLTVPRFRRDDPPTHVVLAPNGDLLRGRLQGIVDGTVVFESRLETFRFPRERISAIVWLREKNDDETGKPPVVARSEKAVQAQLDNGYMLTMTPERMKDGQLIGTSAVLGDCRIPARSIRDLFLGSPDGREEILSYVRWIPTKAPEPAWETPDGSGAPEESDLIGTVAADFELKTLDGEMFRLSDHKDKIVVLDFWASWCGPCIAALPKYIEATSAFDESQAIFVAVNLEESPERIKEFLERQNLSPTVALDRGSVIARRFGVSGIPHSVVLGKGNVVKHVTVGLQEGLKEKTVKRIDALLNESADSGEGEADGDDAAE